MCTKKIDFYLNQGPRKTLFYIFCNSAFCSLTDRLTDKIFIEQMLIYERNVHKKIRFLSQPGTEKNSFLYFLQFCIDVIYQRNVHEKNQKSISIRDLFVLFLKVHKKLRSGAPKNSFEIDQLAFFCGLHADFGFSKIAKKRPFLIFGRNFRLRCLSLRLAKVIWVVTLTQVVLSKEQKSYGRKTKKCLFLEMP